MFLPFGCWGVDVQYTQHICALKKQPSLRQPPTDEAPNNVNNIMPFCGSFFHILSKENLWNFFDYDGDIVLCIATAALLPL